MKPFAATVAFAALLTVAIAGPFAMAHGLDHDATCFLSSVASLPCLTLGTVAEHLAALQRTMTAVPVALMVLALFAALLFALPHLQPSIDLGPPGRWEQLLFASSRTRSPVFRWRARLTHSPTVA